MLDAFSESINNELFAVVFDKAETILQSFWNLNMKGKCAPTVRIGVLLCFVAVMKSKSGKQLVSSTDETDFKVPEDLDLYDSTLTSCAFLSFVSDSHDGIKFLCSSALNKVFSELRDRNEFKYLQKHASTCIFRIAEHFFFDIDKESGTSFLSACLGAIHALFPATNIEMEESVIYQLCHLSYLCCKHKSSKLCQHFLSISFKQIAISAFKAKNGCTDTFTKSHFIEYAALKLQGVFYQWINTNDKTDICSRISTFPYVLFGCESMNQLCLKYIRQIFPVLFIHCKNIVELESAVQTYLKYPDGSKVNKAALKDITKECAAEILSLILPLVVNNEAIAKYESQLDRILQSENTIYALVRHHFAQVIIEILMRQDQNVAYDNDLTACVTDNLHQKIECILKYIIPGKSSNQLHDKLSKAVFCCRTDGCILVELFTNVRKHIGEAWYPHELYFKLTAYKFLISTLFQGEKIEDNFSSYLVKDIVYLMSSFIHSLDLRFKMASELADKKAFVYVAVTCLDIFILLCEFVIRSTGTMLEKTFSEWSIAVPFVSSIAILKLFIKTVSKQNIEDANGLLIGKLDSLFALTISMQHCISLQNLLMFVDETDQSLGVSVCISVFLKSFRILREHDLLHGNNPLINSNTESLSKSLKSFRRCGKFLSSVILEEKMKLLKSLILLPSFGYSCSTSVFACIGEVCMQLPKDLNLEESVNKDAKFKFIFDVLQIISRQVVSVEFQLVKNASRCLYQIFQFTELESFWDKIKKEEPFLMNTLIPFQVEISASMQIKPIQKSIGEIKSFFSDTNKFVCDTPFKNWICQLTPVLIDYCKEALFHIIKPACSYDNLLCSAVLPAVFHDLLVNDPTGKAKDCLSNFVQTSFDMFLNLHENKKSPGTEHMQTLLSVIQYLRCQNVSNIENNLKRHSGRAPEEHTVSNSWANNFWLNINYLSAANISSICGQPFKAILFIEIWKECSISSMTEMSNGKLSACRSLLGDVEHNIKVEVSINPSVLNHDTNLSIEDEKLLCEEILIKSYSAIDDVDSLYGLRKDCFEDSKVMMHIHEKETEWFQALYLYNLQISKSSYQGELSNKILSALKNSGLDHVSKIYENGFRSQGGVEDCTQRRGLENLQYKAALKASKWEDDLSPDSENFKQQFFNCVTSMREEDPMAMSAISILQHDITQLIPTDIGSFLHKRVLSSVSNLVSLGDLLDVYNVVNKNDSALLINLLNDWNMLFTGSESVMKREYNCTNFILSNRDYFIAVLLSKFMDQDLIKKLHIAKERIESQQIHFMINQGRENVALQKLAKLKDNLKAKSSSFEYHKALLDESQLLWNLDKKKEAISISASLQDSLQKNLANSGSSKFGFGYLLGNTLLLRGQWLNDSRMEGPSTIMESYFKKSVDIAERLSGKKAGQCNVNEEQLTTMRISGYKVLAKFADAQYQDVINYMKSSEFEQKRDLFREAQQEIKRAQSKNNPPPNQKYMILLQKNSKLDHKDFTDILQKKDTFLLCALQNYISCLSLSDEDDVLIYRVCALWFANTQSVSVSGLMECACKHIRTYKFVETAYQLAARLSSVSHDVKLQSILQDLLYRMSIDHPHHVLAVVLALANALQDTEMMRNNTKRGSKQVQNSTSTAAKAIIAKVKTSRPDQVSLLEELSNAYIQLANYDASRWSKIASVPINFEKNLLISRYCSLNHKDKYSSLAIPTVEIPVDKSCKYEENTNFVYLRCFKPYFSLCGGINLPKIVIALGSDGKERKHLVKGRDDLRQDAVMQQVFKVVNTLLLQEKASNGLKLRTYKVIPLSQRSGLVEWCEGTIPIGTYLIGTPALKNYGAHHQYRPKDSLSLECRKKLSSAASKPLHLKLQSFENICANFKPVFRHFFYEHFVHPTAWFNRRTAYCRSVACSSVVGYILGLGDRHVQNILIDRSSGEVIHIDLGVAFEQGRCLPTPEMVPFRLTRDMVDGFGSVGVEGPFRRNCEKTMSVLRESIDTISTIVEVLLHDPLHDWMMTSGKALQLQQNMTTGLESEMTSSILNASTVAELLNETVVIANVSLNRSSLAGRALLRVQEKLRGLESGAVLSVEGQINLLIQQATDHERLCAMFAGWQPYI